MKRHGFCLVGCGMVAEFHARAIADMANARLVAVCDRHADSADRFADRHGGRAHTSVAAAVAAEGVDIVCICTPSGLHLEPALAAIRAGRHVVIEKPLEITVERCDAILSAAAAAGVKVSGILQNRFIPANQYARQVVEAGLLGRPTLGSVYNKWWRSQEYYDQGKWRGSLEIDGGGALINQGIHAVDLLLWTMGPVVEVYARAATLCHGNIDVEDTLVATLQFQNGALGVIEAGTGVHPGMPRRLELAGDRGTVVVEGSHVRHHDFADSAGFAPPEPPAATNSDGSQNPSDIDHLPHQLQLEDMIDAVEHARPPAIDGVEARRPIELICAIYESVRTNRSVAVDSRG